MGGKKTQAARIECFEKFGSGLPEIGKSVIRGVRKKGFVSF